MSGLKVVCQQENSMSNLLWSLISCLGFALQSHETKDFESCCLISW